MSSVINVNMAEFDVARPPDALCTMGIGSCIAICLHDTVNRIGGLAHIMLPWNKANDQSINGKFADTGVAELIQLMGSNGSAQINLVAKIVGGASVFLNMQKTPAIEIGKSNIEAVKQVLAGYRIRIAAEEVGGSFGRGMTFYPETGVVKITVLTQPPTYLAI